MNLFLLADMIVAKACFRGHRLHFGVTEARDEVVVVHADALHVGVACCRTDKRESARFHLFTHRFRDRARGPIVHFASEFVINRLPVRELPDVRCERAKFFLYREERLCVPDRRRDFLTIPDNPRIVEQTGNIACRELRDFFRVKVRERLFETLAFLQHQSPGEAGLKGV